MFEFAIPRKGSPFQLHCYPAHAGVPSPGHEPFDFALTFLDFPFLLSWLKSELGQKVVVCVNESQDEIMDCSEHTIRAS
jgi:hypothetical protein